MSLHPIEASEVHARRERVFLVLAGLFLGTLAMLNILGILRFIKLGELETATWGTLTFAVAIGVLPYPVTFLCTDLGQLKLVIRDLKKIDGVVDVDRA